MTPTNDPSEDQAQHRLQRFRAGPFRAYRFEAGIVDSGAGRTRVDRGLRTDLRGIDGDAWRDGDRAHVSRSTTRCGAAWQPVVEVQFWARCPKNSS